MLENILYSWHIHPLYVHGWATVSEYILSSLSAFLDHLRFSVGFISASWALKMADASQLLVCAFFIFQDCYLTEKANIPRMHMKQLGVPSINQRCWVGLLGGYKCLSGAKSSKWPIFWVGPWAGKKGSGFRLTRWGRRSWEASRGAVWFKPWCCLLEGSPCPLGCWGASLWATNRRPWQPLQELGKLGKHMKGCVWGVGILGLGDFFCPHGW